MALTDSRQTCPCCFYDCELTFQIVELARLRQPYLTDDLTTCQTAERHKLPQCRRCGYVIGIEDPDDESQQKALAYGARINGTPVDSAEVESAEETEEESVETPKRRSRS